jgi:histidinol dehydrogenase
LAEKVISLLPEIIAKLSPQRREFCEKVFATYGGILLCRSMKEAIGFCNDYAVEHLLVKTQKANEVVAQLKNCGEILIGETTPIVLANFGTGANAVLPTGRKALSYDCTSVWAFLKRTSLSYATREGYRALRPAVETLALYEGFGGHALVMQERRDVPAGDFKIPKPV